MSRSDDTQNFDEPGAEPLESVAALYEKYRPRVYALCLQMTHSSEDAADLLQETFVRVLRYRATFDGRSSFETWLYRVARNVCLDFLQRGTEPHGARRPAAAVFPDADLRLERLRRALLKLAPEQREVIVLSRFHGLNYAQLARVLECSEGTARVRVHRAIAELERLYEDSPRRKS